MQPLWICAAGCTTLALEEAANTSSQPQQGRGVTTFFPAGLHRGCFAPPPPQAAELPWLMFFPDLCLHGVKHLFGSGEGKGNTVFATLTSVSPDACASWLGSARPGAPLLGARDPSHPTDPHRGLQGSWVSHHHPRGRSHYLLCHCGQRCHLRATHGASSILPCSGGMRS